MSDGDPYGGQWGQHQQLRPHVHGNDYSTPPRSTTLVWAGVLQIIMSSIFVVFGVVVFAIGVLAKDAFDRMLWLDRSDTNTVVGLIVAIGLVILAVAVTMIVLAAYAMKRSNGARIVSAVLEIVFAVFALLSVISGGDSSAAAGVLLLGTATAATLYLLPTSAAACRADRFSR